MTETEFSLNAFKHIQMQWRDTGVTSKGVCKAQMCNIFGRDIEWGVILSALSGKASNNEYL